MDTKTIVICLISLILGMLVANMLKNVCGCKVVEGQGQGQGCCLVNAPSDVGVENNILHDPNRYVYGLGINLHNGDHLNAQRTCGECPEGGICLGVVGPSSTAPPGRENSTTGNCWPSNTMNSAANTSAPARPNDQASLARPDTDTQIMVPPPMVNAWREWDSQRGR